MSSKPLQIENSFFSLLHIEANPHFQPSSDEQPEQGDVEVEVRIQFARHRQDASRYQLKLTIDRVEGQGFAIPYLIELEILGSFRVADDVPAEKVRQLVEVHGGALLYTSAREQVLTLTGRGPWGAFQLPTLNLHGAWQAQAAQAKREESDKPAPQSEGE